MSVLDFSKNHGKTIQGVGLASVALSIVFAANGAFKRFDKAEELMWQVPAITADVKDIVADLDEARAGLRQDAADLAALPAFGVAAGESLIEPRSEELRARKEAIKDTLDRLKAEMIEDRCYKSEGYWWCPPR